MITPRVTRLVRVPDLAAMRAAIARRASGSDLSVRRTAVVVPTRGAGDALRRSIESRALRLQGDAVLVADIVTRGDLYHRLHGSLPGAPPLLTDVEREVMLRKAARDAAAAGHTPPFRVRAGLVVQMLDFYDELRRREQTLDDFARHTAERLRDSAETDRGAARLLEQTGFLCEAFARFERAVSESGSIDEHGLRAVLLASDGEPQRAYDRIIVTVADQAADPLGLHASDFDLLTRLPGVSAIDVVATEGLLASGFHERIHHLLPGLAEEREPEPSLPPVLVAPESAEPDQYWFTCRDREEELADVVRWLKHRRLSPHSADHPPALDRFGIVFQRPLPYLYLARQVFGDGGLRYQTLDALPLSAEPFAATVDVVFSFLSSQATRTAVLELLRSPHLVFASRVDRQSLAALDARLRAEKYVGGWDRLAQLDFGESDAAPALAAAGEAAAALTPVCSLPAASSQIDTLLRFFRDFERVPAAEAEWVARHRRARAAILAALQALRDAHARYDDGPLDLVELTGAVRRWIDAQTFAPRTGHEGIRLLDAASAAYADLDEIRLVGLVERDWPEPMRRSIFYPASILSNLGWPADASRLTAARARFRDLLSSAARRVSASVFSLEDDGLVAPSSFLEELESAGLPIERWPAPPPARVFVHEAMLTGSLPGARHQAVSTTAAEWLALRSSRSPREEARYKGAVGARDPQTYAISYLERYLECPFKYFAGRVLRLPEERDEESGLTPIERGHFIHDVFETFFKQWQAEGHGTITTGNAADALEMFEQIAERKLERLPEADRALERTHLLGSAAASGLAERAFAFEIEQGGEVVERLLEHPLEGDFVFTGPGGSRRTLRIRAKADRLDLMADGTIRVIDYKLGKAPKTSRALQLPIYGVMAAQALEGHRGRTWTVSTAGYVAFKEKEAFVPLGGRPGNVAAAIAEGQERLLATVEAIERGEFPVDPEEPFKCQWCGYAAVCRKDYVGDE